jgi:hypothetical protein
LIVILGLCPFLWIAHLYLFAICFYNDSESILIT